MDASRMTFDEPPALRWESVILQGDKQRSLDKLAPVLLSRYPNNPNLQEAVAPWIHGNPEEVVDRQGIKSSSSVARYGAGQAEAIPEQVAPIPVVPLIIRQQIPGTAIEVEMVPVLVPRDMQDDATVALLATINSLRRTIAQHEKDIAELVAWRSAISTMSRSEVAERTGGNEPGESFADPVAKAAADAQTLASGAIPATGAQAPETKANTLPPPGPQAAGA